jgi:hypothetical protein
MSVAIGLSQTVPMTRSVKLAARTAVATLAIGLSTLSMAGAAFASPPPDGTVGNADGKTPAGQSVGDKNNGYECDANHGIGTGNPAHTGCTPSGTPAG